MSIKDFSNAWDEAAQRVLQTIQDSELSHQQLSGAAGLRVRTGMVAGLWEGSDLCTQRDCDEKTVGCF